MANNNRLPTIALIKILERIQEKRQKFGLRMVDDQGPNIPYQYELLTIGTDGKTYLLHVKGAYVSHGTGYQPLAKGTYTDERIVNLAHVAAIVPCKEPAA